MIMIYIKKCYDTYNACSAGENGNNHNCTANGKSNLFLDKNDNTYKDCYETCAICSKNGSSINYNCNTCISGY